MLGSLKYVDEASILAKGVKLSDEAGEVLTAAVKHLDNVSDTSKKSDELAGAFANAMAKHFEDTEVIVEVGYDFQKFGKYVKNPDIVIDWDKCTNHAWKRIQERGLTRQDIDDIVKNGKTLLQDSGNKFAYITKDGVVIIDKDGKIITAWGKNDFDDNMKMIVEKLFGK